VQSENIYSFLLSQGAPPEMIRRLMDQIKNNSGAQGLFQDRSMGYRGSVAGQTAYGARPQGIYGPPSPPRV
jgi:hypothetical protein